MTYRAIILAGIVIAVAAMSGVSVGAAGAAERTATNSSAPLPASPNGGGVAAGNIKGSNGTKGSNATAPKVIVLGFDGVDPLLAQKFMDEGKLPNMKKLAEAGHFGPLGTMNPAESPVCWSSMLNGTNPGKHGVVRLE